jgi:5-methylcytosine-specific restriction endonuclease McrA
MSGSIRKNCLDCDIEFDALPKGRGTVAKRCPDCQLAYKTARGRAVASANRAQKGGSGRVEVVLHNDVFERDNWICYLCGNVVPEESRNNTGTHLGKYDPLAPSLEHVIPRSRGGDHTLDNLRTAHKQCNQRKFTNAQLPTVKPVAAAVTYGTPACIVDGCPRNAAPYHHGWCNTHHYRWKNTGDPLKARCGCGCGELIAVPAEQRGKITIPGHRTGALTSNTLQGQLHTRFRTQPVSDYGRELGLADDCRIWTGSTIDSGHGVVSYRIDFSTRKATPAHRAVYMLAHGADSVTGKVVDHLCRERLCININHLEAVTHAENLARTPAKTHCPKGHPYILENICRTSRSTVCAQCARNVTHIRDKGHEFVVDPSNPSTKRHRCLVCHQGRGVKPAA